MRKYFPGVFAIALCLSGAALVHRANRQDALLDENQEAVGATDGAFRDGLYQGQLAIARGSEAHVAVGRWAAPQDRTSFAAGYRKGYMDSFTANNDAVHATNAAFRDGLFVGTLTAKRGGNYHAATGRWATEGDRASFIAGYRQGYAENLTTSSAGAVFASPSEDLSRVGP
jgi:hypothetical protein